jgi:hypothetical protein
MARTKIILLRRVSPYGEKWPDGAPKQCAIGRPWNGIVEDILDDVITIYN